MRVPFVVREQGLFATDPRLLQSETTADWVKDNVWNPMVNGSGVLQVYNTFASKPVALPEVPQAETFSKDWMVHTLSEVSGAILPYLAMGKLSGYALKGLGARCGATGFTKAALGNEGVAMVVGAGVYDFTKAPREGETRLGNSLGSMATFTTFESGNALIKYSTGNLKAPVLKALTVGGSRAVVGGLGGIAGFETSHFVTELQGVQNNTTRKQMWDAIASGSFLNVGLPLVHKGLTQLANKYSITPLAGVDAQSVRALLDLRTAHADGNVARFYLEPESLQPRNEAHAAPAVERPGNEMPRSSTDGNTARALQGGEAAEAQRTRPVEAEARADSKVVPLDRHAWGSPDQLGATVTDAGVNFALHSKGATKVELLLFDTPEAKQPSQVLPMFRTNDTWHRFVGNEKPGALYLYRVEGPYDPAGTGARFNGNKALIDPYSKAVTGDNAGDMLGYDNSNPSDPDRHLRPSTTDNIGDMPKSVVVKLGEFDWTGDKSPNTPMTDTVIYEAGVRGFTATDPAVTHKGTYRGLVEKIPYLKELGITAVELLPIMKFDKADWPHLDPETGKPLGNAWGYNTVAFQAPEGRFAADGTRGQQVTEFKHMVKELHNAGIEVILDIVFNHTREGDQFGPTVSFKGLDNNTYYLLTPGHPEKYVNHTGCGNTMNCNHPVVQKLILDTLRYWKTEMHVDGFRFDLASIFNYDVNGHEQNTTPIIGAIQNDAVLKDVKLIAEAWSPANYRLGKFSDSRWSEWNGSYRDVVRKFIKGDSGQTATLADRIAGSPGWFDASKGRYSINFVTAHDGFTMRDLVSYNEKHNSRNGENNRDGSNDNFSWNCGHEGPVKDSGLPAEMQAAIERLRTQQQKNLLAMLFLSRGTPMLLYGDEIRRTQKGNNNAWPVEDLNNMDWQSLPQNADMLRFTQLLIGLRARQEIGRLSPASIIWHGTEPFKADFGDGARFIAWEYKPNAGKPPLYTAFNAYWEPLKLRLPPGKWTRLMDTGLPSGQDIVRPEAGTPLGHEYIIQPRTSIVLEGKPSS